MTLGTLHTSIGEEHFVGRRWLLVAEHFVEEAGAEHSPLDRWGVRACISLNLISLRALLLTFSLPLSLAHHRGPRSTTRNAKGTRP